MQSLEKIDISMWADYEFSDAQMDVFPNIFIPLKMSLNFIIRGNAYPSKQLRSMKQGSIPKSRSHRDWQWNGIR